MTTLRAVVVGDRVMLVHDGAAETRWSEMLVADAELLVRQMQIAIRQAQEVTPDALRASIP